MESPIPTLLLAPCCTWLDRERDELLVVVVVVVEHHSGPSSPPIVFNNCITHTSERGIVVGGRYENE